MIMFSLIPKGKCLSVSNKIGTLFFITLLELPNSSGFCFKDKNCANLKLIMNIVTRANNLEITPALRDYLDKRLGSLSKLVKSGHNENIETRVELGRISFHHRKGEVYFAEINLRLGKNLLRAHQESISIYSAIDEAKDELRTELLKFKGKRETILRRGARSVGKLFRISPLARFRKK